MSLRVYIPFLGIFLDNPTNMTDLVCIKVFTNRAQAEVVKTLLESHGIAAIVQADDCGGLRPHLVFGAGGVKVLVRKEDEAKVISILTAKEDSGEA